MADLKLDIAVDFHWIKEDGDCSKCKSCEDLIFGNKFTLYLLMYSGKLSADFSETDFIICESCYGCLEKEEK